MKLRSIEKSFNELIGMTEIGAVVSKMEITDSLKRVTESERLRESAGAVARSKPRTPYD